MSSRNDRGNDRQTSSQKAAAVQKSRNERVSAALAGAGSAADRENKIIQQNTRESAAKTLKQFESGQVKLTQAEFDKTVAIARGFLDPNTGKPTGKTQSRLGINKQNSLLRGTSLEQKSNSNLISTTSQQTKAFVDATTTGKKPSISKFLLRNPTGTAPAIQNPDRFNNFVVTKPQLTGNTEIDKVFEGQRQTTILIAQEFQKRRNRALADGKTVAEANAEASEFVGLSKDLQSGINTALQTDIVQQRATALKAAEARIRSATQGSADPDSIRNLGDFVKQVKGSKIQQINIQTDAEGKDLSPRKSKLQIENALLTGSKFDEITFNIDVDDRIKSGDSRSNADDSLTVIGSDGQVTISTDRIKKFISPSALQVGLQENDPLSFLLSQAEVSPELQKQSPLFGGEGGKVSEFIDSPAGLTPSDILGGEETQSGFDVGEQNGEVVIANGNDEVFRGTQQEALEFITNLINSANAQNNEQLQGQLATLRDTVSKGESISLLLETVLGILASLSSGGTGNRKDAKSNESVDSTSPIQTLDPLSAFFGFINQIIDNTISLVTGK